VNECGDAFLGGLLVAALVVGLFFALGGGGVADE
jgi:hypothetical protein